MNVSLSYYLHSRGGILRLYHQRKYKDLSVRHHVLVRTVSTSEVYFRLEPDSVTEDGSKWPTENRGKTGRGIGPAKDYTADSVL